MACTTPDVMPLRGLWRVTQSARGGCTHQHILQPFGKQYILNIYSKFHSNTLPISAPLAPLVTGRGSRSASPVARMKTSPRSIPIVRRGIVLRVSLITFPPGRVQTITLLLRPHTITAYRPRTSGTCVLPLPFVCILDHASAEFNVNPSW